MKILGIETSCDETAAAVVQDGIILLSNVVASSQDMHAKYGGIIPDKAAREQLKSIIPVIHEALSIADRKLQIADLDAIAVTVGPGLIGSLLIGVETAKALALAWNKPLIPVNHLVGHIYANWITSNKTPLPLDLSFSLPLLPALVLLVSGGHTDLVLMTDHGKFTHLGSTRDDAAGECFDKCGRLLGLPYPYGPYIQDLAEKYGGILKVSLPRPLHDSKDLDFSFSGLKTAFLNELNKHKDKVSPERLYPALANELQEAVTDSLVSKTLKAALKFKPKSILLAGGVAANKRLREKLQSAILNLHSAINVHIPPIKLCTDNAAYIASASFFNYHPASPESIEASPGLVLA